MTLERDRNLFWDRFFKFIRTKPRQSFFNEMTKEAFVPISAIQVYRRDDVRLMVGINKKYARCSLHITWDNPKNSYSDLKSQESDIGSRFKLNRSPNFMVKLNRKSIVFQLRDHGYSFTPNNIQAQKEAMEWMYQNVCVMFDLIENLG